MIRTFGDKKTAAVYDQKFVKSLTTEIQQKALEKLRLINVAVEIEDLIVPPSNRLHKLGGNLKDFYSISINTKWRIVFIWEDGHADEVKITDYH